MSISLAGIVIAQLIPGMLGVLAFSGEYATGMIRATLAVVPSRLPVLWAKLIVLVGLVLPLSLLAAVTEFFVATALESSRGGSAISLTDPGVRRWRTSLLSRLADRGQADAPADQLREPVGRAEGQFAVPPRQAGGRGPLGGFRDQLERVGATEVERQHRAAARYRLEGDRARCD